MKGTIISVLKGNPYPVTVIYERNGQRYRGCQYGDEQHRTYYFGGAAHLQNASDIDEALERGFPALATKQVSP